MNLEELDNFKLAKAISFNTDLNPQIFIGDKMRPLVRNKLIEIADHFREFLGVQDIALVDIEISGSNAAYSYTPHSDVDLHLIVDFTQLPDNAVYKEMFDAKKYQYNHNHDIKIKGYEVELYVQDAAQKHSSLGSYSVLNNDWNRIPTRQRANLNDDATILKYEKLKNLAIRALASDSPEYLNDVLNLVKKYRQAGLDEFGEFGPENLAFKMLRTDGYFAKLWDKRRKHEDQSLSLEQKKEEPDNLAQELHAAFEQFQMEDNNSPSGVVYHGTDGYSYQRFIKRKGLIPRFNKWEVSRIEDPVAQQKALRSTTRAIFTTPDIESAKEFGEIVLAFKLLPTDKVEGEKFLSGEVLVFNRVDPSRLSVAWIDPEADDYLDEDDDSYQAPEINVGDEVKVGKFKNRKATVKGFDTDKDNQPVLKTDKGEHKLFKPRISKLEDELAEEFEQFQNEELADTLTQVPYNKILANNLTKAYPEINITNVNDMVETNDGFQVYMYPEYAQISGTLYVGLIIIDAYTKQYKNVLTDTIKEITNEFLKFVDAEPALFIFSDESAGAWQYIAKKLGYKLIQVDRDENMQISEMGRVVKGVNTTQDVDVDEMILDEDRITHIAWQLNNKLIQRFGDDTDDWDPTVDAINIVKKLATASPKAVQWLANRYVAGDFKIEDLGQIKQELIKFKSLKNKLSPEEKDLNRMTLNDLYDVLEKYGDEEVTSNRAKDKQQKAELISSGQADILYKDSTLIVLTPKTEEASCYFGKGTMWCTASSNSENYFQDYNSKGDLYIIMTKADGKFQFHFDTNSYMDARDQTLDPEHLLSLIAKYPKLKVALGDIAAQHHFIPLMNDLSDSDIHDAMYYKPWNIQYIEDPSEDLQLAAVSREKGGHNVQYIKNPTEKVQLAAIKYNASHIKRIENPTDAVKKAANKFNEGVGIITKQNQTADVGPNQTKIEAAKLGHTVTKGGIPPLLKTNGKAKPVGNIMEGILQELNMAPGSLQKQVSSIVKSADPRIGVEFEIIIPHDKESNPDIDDNTSLNDIREFFSYDEPEAFDQMGMRHQDWIDDKGAQWTGDQTKDTLNNPMEEDQLKTDFMVDNYVTSVEADDIIAKITGSEPATEITTEIAEKTLEVAHKAYKEAGDADEWPDGIANSYLRLYKEIFIDDGDDAIEHFNEFYNQEFYNTEYAYNDEDYSIGKWLRSHHLNSMGDVYREFEDELTWPGGPLNNEDFNDELGYTIANDLEGIVGETVSMEGGDSYGDTDTSKTWVVTGDSSIRPDNTGDSGFEIITSVMQYEDGIANVESVIDYLKEKGGYANETTGLHINVSLGNIDQGKLDYGKLVLMLGDSHVLKHFGREYNEYALEALVQMGEMMDDQQGFARDKPEKAKSLAALMNSMKSNTSNAIAQSFDNVNFGKYSSVNLRDGWIEFRSAGGADYIYDFEAILASINRFIVAYAVASDPDSHRKEYAKKLYKLAANVGKGQASKNAMTLFAGFGSGMITKEDLIRQLKARSKARRSAEAEVDTGEPVDPAGVVDAVQMIADKYNISDKEAQEEYEDGKEAEMIDGKDWKDAGRIAYLKLINDIGHYKR